MSCSQNYCASTHAYLVDREYTCGVLNQQYNAL